MAAEIKVYNFTGVKVKLLLTTKRDQIYDSSEKSIRFNDCKSFYLDLPELENNYVNAKVYGSNSYRIMGSTIIPVNPSDQVSLVLAVNNSGDGSDVYDFSQDPSSIRYFAVCEDGKLQFNDILTEEQWLDISDESTKVYGWVTRSIGLTGANVDGTDSICCNNSYWGMLVLSILFLVIASIAILCGLLCMSRAGYRLYVKNRRL